MLGERWKGLSFVGKPEPEVFELFVWKVVNLLDLELSVFGKSYGFFEFENCGIGFSEIPFCCPT